MGSAVGLALPHIHPATDMETVLSSEAALKPSWVSCTADRS